MNSPTDWHAWSRLAPPEAFEAFLEDVRRGERTQRTLRFVVEISPADDDLRPLSLSALSPYEDEE